MRRLKIEVKVQQGLPPGYGASLPAEPFPRDKDVTKKYITSS
jgi:hypothetical protein